VLFRSVSPPVGIEAELDWDDQALQEGEESIARLVLRNVTDGTVRDVRVEVEAPFAVRVEQAAESLGELEPGQEREVSWTLHPVGGLESGSLHVAVATANSGSLLLRRPFRVVGAEPTPTAQTAVVPLR